MKKANKGVTAEDILASRIRPIASVSVREGGAFDHGDGVGEDDFLLWSGRLASDEARDGGQKGGLEAAADEAALSPFEDGLRLKFKNVVRVWGKRTFQIDEDNDFEARQRWMSLHRAEVAAAAQAQVTAAKEKGSGRGLGDKAARPGARAGTLASGSALRAATGGATGPLSGLGSSDQSEGFGNGREGVGEGGGGEMRVEDDFISNVTFGIDSLNPKIGPGVPKHWPLSLEVPLLRKIVCNENIIFLLTKQNELLCVGVADNGCLGLGEQQTLTREPARIHFVPSMFRSLPAPLDPAYSPFRTDPTVSSSLESPNNNSNPISGTAVSSGPAVPAGPLKPSPLPGISPAGSPGSPLSPGVSEVVDEVFGAELRMQREAQALGLTAPTIIDVVCGNAFALALSAEGRVYAWGAARFCGLATMHDIYTPTVLDHSLFDASISNAAAQNQQRPSSPKSPTSPASPTPAHIVAIGACGTMAAAMRNDGAFFLWGVLQGVAALSRPTLIGQFRNKNYRNFKIHCGLKFGLIRADDDLYQFGHGLNHEILTQPQTADTQQFARFAPAVSSCESYPHFILPPPRSHLGIKSLRKPACVCVTLRDLRHFVGNCVTLRDFAGNCVTLRCRFVWILPGIHGFTFLGHRDKGTRDGGLRLRARSPTDQEVATLRLRRECLGAVRRREPDRSRVGTHLDIDTVATRVRCRVSAELRLYYAKRRALRMG